MLKHIKFLKGNEIIFKTACIFAGSMCLIALIPISISSFYKVLHYSVCIVSFWVAIVYFKSREYIGGLVFSIIAFLFNPFLYVELNAKYWKVIYIISPIFFFIASNTHKANNKYMEILFQDREKFTNEYLRIEELLKQAEIERQKAIIERKLAEELRKKFEEELKRISTVKNSAADMKDPYDVLGVHKNDSLETIKEVYRSLVRIYHPDRFVQADELSRKQKTELMAIINASYEWILKNHMK